MKTTFYEDIFYNFLFLVSIFIVIVNGFFYLLFYYHKGNETNSMITL